MELRFEQAKLLPELDGFWLAVKPLQEDLGGVRRWLYGERKGLQALTVKKYRKKRSLDANAYAWVLLDKLAEAMRLPKEEIYRQTIEDLGGVSEQFALRAEAVSSFAKSWERGHVGRLCKDLGPHTSAPGYHIVECYYGSSDYDTAQMAQLIDLLVQDCEALGIETMSDRERSLLLEEWDAKKN